MGLPRCMRGDQTKLPITKIVATYAILSSRVELTTEITILNVELRLVDDAGHHVRLAVGNELHALDGTLGHETGAVALLGAVGNDITLGGTDVAHLGGTPQAEV